MDAKGGAIGIDMAGNTVTVLFERTANDAKRTEGAYKIMAAGFDVPVDDVLARKGNVVMSWENSPTEDQASSIEDCLTS